MRARSLLRMTLPRVGLVKVDQPVFNASFPRHDGRGRWYTSRDVRTAKMRIFANTETLAIAARHEGWTTLYVYEVRGWPDGPIYIRGSVDPGPWICPHAGRCSCLWRR